MVDNASSSIRQYFGDRCESAGIYAEAETEQFPISLSSSCASELF